MSTERIGRLDLLSRLCRRKGWALLVRSSGDRHNMLTGSRIVALDVVEPGVGDSRRRQLLAGDLVARMRVTGPRELELAAATITEALAQRGHFDFDDAEAA